MSWSWRTGKCQCRKPPFKRSFPRLSINSWARLGFGVCGWPQFVIVCFPSARNVDLTSQSLVLLIHQPNGTCRNVRPSPAGQGYAKCWYQSINRSSVHHSYIRCAIDPNQRLTPQVHMEASASATVLHSFMWGSEHLSLTKRTEPQVLLVLWRPWLASASLGKGRQFQAAVCCR